MNVGLKLDGPAVIVGLYSEAASAQARMTAAQFAELLKGGEVLLGRARAMESQLAAEAAAAVAPAVAKGARRLAKRKGKKKG